VASELTLLAFCLVSNYVIFVPITWVRVYLC